ncbi:hypothetical protein DFH11DRAFT_1615380 [Phellopilus nigrolimitatus]|nr:hypothetical protein DFH11DRAFT_1615380 [Phellopilus nigrolimitatus]
MVSIRVNPYLYRRWSYPRMAICGCADHPRMVTISLQISRVFDNSLPNPLVHGERICMSVISRFSLLLEPAIQAGHKAFRQDEDKKEDSQLLKSVKDSTRSAAEAQHGLIMQVLKNVLFSSRPD